MTFTITTFSTPFGPFSAALTSNGAVVATAFGDVGALRGRLPRSIAVDFREDAKLTAEVRRQVQEYGDGRRREFALALAPLGTDFQIRVWRELAAVPYGTTCSYAELAGKIGSGPRAVGHANARNPICLILPCHRVVGASGALTGFAFGVALKEQLLAHERRADIAAA